MEYNNTDLPKTIVDLKTLINRCEQRIRELRWEELAKNTCQCDRYTCYTCQQMTPLYPFVSDEAIAAAGWSPRNKK